MNFGGHIQTIAYRQSNFHGVTAMITAYFCSPLHNLWLTEATHFKYWKYSTEKKQCSLTLFSTSFFKQMWTRHWIFLQVVGRLHGKNKRKGFASQGIILTGWT
jgi:hypothetical protein